MMRVVGRRKTQAISRKPSGDKLKEGILFIEEMGKLCPVKHIPKGVYHFKSHDEMNRHEMDCIVNAMKKLQKKRHRHV